MDIRLVMRTARSATIELNDGGTYETKERYRLLLNGIQLRMDDTVITSLSDLKPYTEYVLDVQSEDGADLGIFLSDREEFVTIM